MVQVVMRAMGGMVQAVMRAMGSDGERQMKLRSARQPLTSCCAAQLLTGAGGGGGGLGTPALCNLLSENVFTYLFSFTYKNLCFLACLRIRCHF